MPTRNVVLTERHEKVISKLVASGRYQNASEVLREGLRLIEERDSRDAAKLKILREAARAGFADFAAGRFLELEDDAIEEALGDLGREVRRRDETMALSHRNSSAPAIRLGPGGHRECAFVDGAALWWSNPGALRATALEGTARPQHRAAPARKRCQARARQRRPGVTICGTVGSTPASRALDI